MVCALSGVTTKKNLPPPPQKKQKNKNKNKKQKQKTKKPCAYVEGVGGYSPLEIPFFFIHKIVVKLPMLSKQYTPWTHPFPFYLDTNKHCSKSLCCT